MVSAENNSHSSSNDLTATIHSTIANKIQHHSKRTIRTVRSNLFEGDHASCAADTLTDSLFELVSRNNKFAKSSVIDKQLLELSQTFRDFSGCNSDISWELLKLATVSSTENNEPTAGVDHQPEPKPEPCLDFLQRENFSTEIIDSISLEDLQPTVKICIHRLHTPSSPRLSIVSKC